MTTTETSVRRPVESVDPNSGRVWERFEHASGGDVVQAVNRAREAQREWRRLPLRERAAAAGRLRATLFERREAIADTISRETGKPPFEALFEVLVVADAARFAEKHAPAALRTKRSRSRHLAMLRKTIEVSWEPYGVVGIISPWNYPLLLSASPLIPAIVAGNGVVLKPSEYTPGTGVALIDAMRAAGIPPDLVQAVQGDGSVGATLIASGIDRLFFTGSEVTGRRVAAACGERLIPVSLELGGSDPAIVLEDADPAVAAAGIAWGRFSNAGQTCTAPKRAYIVDAVWDDVVRELSRIVSSLRIEGEARDLGALIRAEQKDRITEQESEAIERGARVIASGRAEGASELLYVPKVLADVDERMRVLREETFGPLLPLVRVRSAEEAIERANASSFGLSASIWTRNAARARELASRLEAGTVMINDSVLVAGMAEVPHGGVKSSGMGRLHGIAGLTEAAQSKTVVVDTFASLKQVWWFPYTERMREGIDAFFQFAHGRGFLRRVRAGVRAVRLLYFR